MRYFDDIQRSGGEVPLEEVIRILKEIASALIFLHKKRILHRDLKAENVLIASDLSTRLMDFGLSKLVDFTLQNMTARIGEYLFRGKSVLTIFFLQAHQSIWHLN